MARKIAEFFGTRLLSAAEVGVVGTLAAIAALLVVDHRTLPALVVAFIPLAAFCFNRTRFVYVGLLMPVLAATLVFGRSADVPVGPVYLLDATVVLVVLLTLPTIIDAAARYPAISAVLLFLIGITAAEVFRAGISRVVLRQSVLGFYAIWVFVGIAVARANLLERFARVVFWAAVGTTVVFAIGLTLVSNLRSPTPLAPSLYISYGLLVVLFASNFIRHSLWLNVLIAVQIAFIGLGMMRSVWFAFAVAVGMTLAISSTATRATRRIVRLLALASAVLIFGAFVYPSTIASVSREAVSVIDDNAGTKLSNDNAKWRLTNWQYAIAEIRKHPILGIGFGQPEVPASVCKAACSLQNAHDDPTVLNGSDLHNSILAIPLRLGLPALLALLMFEVMVIERARRSARRSTVVQWLFGCHVLTAFTALTAVVLEGPYMGIFFWFFGGLVIGAGSATESSGMVTESDTTTT